MLRLVQSIARTTTRPSSLAITQARKMSSAPQFIDIGVNLTDPVFRGSYHGKQAHTDDLDAVLSRANSAGVIAQILTGGNLAESHEALELANRYDGFYSTAGCHPTRTSEMNDHPEGPGDYLAKIKEVIEEGKGKVVAVGECGLDYDRLHFAPKEVQKKHFATQLGLAVEVKLPLFLHSRACHEDFVEILKPRIDEIHTALQAGAGAHKDDAEAKRVGVVHSFTGTIAEVKELLDLGLFIGINGCSLKTQENLDVLQHIPLSRLMLETGKSLSLLLPVFQRRPNSLPFRLSEQMRRGATLARPTLPTATSNPSNNRTPTFTLSTSLRPSKRKSGTPTRWSKAATSLASSAWSLPPLLASRGCPSNKSPMLPCTIPAGYSTCLESNTTYNRMNARTNAESKDAKR